MLTNRLLHLSCEQKKYQILLLCIGRITSDLYVFRRLVQFVLITPPLEAEYCDERVCLSVCMSVYPQPYLLNWISDLRQFLHVT